MNVFMILIYSITEIYQVICINEIMKINHDKREKPILPEYVIWSGAILVLNLVLFLIGIPIVNFLTSCVVIFVCGQLLFNGTWKSKIYSTVFLCILGAAIEMVVVACIFFLYKNGLIGSMSSQNTMLFGAVASKFLLYANIKIIAKKAGKQKADIPDTHWMILALIAMTNIYILYLVAEAAQKMETEVFRIQSMIVYIMIIIINYLEFYVHDQMIKRTDYILQNRLLEQQACYYETQLKDREFVELEIRKLKHNISNHYICLQKYADDKDLEGLQSYLKELVEELPSAHGVSNSGNTVIDSILNYKINQGRALGIEFGLKVEVPDSVGVERSSLSVILGNALDNAIRGCMEAKAAAPKIEILIRFVKGCLYLEITNPFEKVVCDEKGALVSTKEDTCCHGFGLRSIQGEVDKYNGELKLESRNGMFKLFILLFGKM